jgi:hypothetical protein
VAVRLADAVLDLWRDVVVYPALASIADCVAAVTVPELLVESTREERLTVLAEMRTAAEVLQELKQIRADALADLQAAGSN